MSGTSEWHRAGLAIGGVSLVLLIAAGIHFIAPARPDRSAVSPSITAATRATTEASIEASPATEELSPIMLEAPPSLRGPLVPAHSARRTPVVEAAPPDDLPPSAGEPAFATPLAASVEIPEESLLVEPIHMPVNAEFVEPMLPAVARDDQGARDIGTTATRQRDPVTAAFVTAGSAVAGGFRSAGRALRRAF